MADQTWKVNSEEQGLRLDKWLALKLGSRGKAFDAISKGRVFLNGDEQVPMQAGRRLEGGESVRVWFDRPGSAQRRVFTDRRVKDLHILFEDDQILVVNKAPGLLTVPLPAHPEEESLFEQIGDYLKKHSRNQPQIVHRIDRDTSGLVVFAKNPAARENLKQQFIARKPVRVYLAVVKGQPEPATGNWRDWVIWDEEKLVLQKTRKGDYGSVEASCKYKTIEQLPNAAVLEVSLETGKQNQIRAQAAFNGHPLIGERQYAPKSLPNFPRQALHAFKLQFKHPRSGETVKLEAPVPEDLNQLIVKLKSGAAGVQSTAGGEKPKRDRS